MANHLKRVLLHSTVVPPHSCRKLHHPWSGLIEKLSDINCLAVPSWARLGSLVMIVLPHLRVGKIRHLGCHSFILFVTPHSSLSARYFHSAFSRATKLARPLAKVVFYRSVVFWKKRTEQKATNIPNHEKLTQRSVRYFQQQLKLFYTNKTTFRIKNTRKKYVWLLLEMFHYKVMTHFVNLGLIFVDRLCKNTKHQHVAATRHML